MAALQERNCRYRVFFNFRGKQWAFTLGRVGHDEASAEAAQVDYLLMRIKQGLIALPPGADVVEFFKHDGSPPATPPPEVTGANASSSLGGLRDHYLATHASGTLEVHTVLGIRCHFGHLCRLLGEGFEVRGLR